MSGDPKMFTDQFIISISNQQRLQLIEVLQQYQQTNPEQFNENSTFEYFIESLQDIINENEDYPIHDLHS